ncbi:hypothetical protein AALO_G00169250 [Alosa alosa]|uniref:Sushi domain-containing protein n=1 Tax=Alosa alosa TaxID=278164 RepID=A0AAV6GCC4_9TELE|nr:uncharacterized protein LOC121680616 [Alosa sapidissima]XP_048115911.1 uncharacterized protein LOC125305261 [Alosa alosa]KAG5272783.1 hypothetical protein AALO_G00169250 [Alosa alosa]
MGNWGRMADLYSFLIHTSILSTLFMVTLAVDRAMLCEEDSLLVEMSRDVEIPSECVLSCTAQTYGRMLLRQDIQTVRFKCSYTGDKGEYCWPTRISCSAGESLLQAYVILPVHKSTISGESPGLQTTSVTHKNLLRPHRGQVPLSDECGLFYNVMDYFGGTKWEPFFCVKVVPHHHILGESMRCPPFLVTVWQKQNHSPVNHGEG